MGCGGSRLNAEREAIPAKLRPLLRRRMEEIWLRRRSGPVRDDASPKKELLLDGKPNDDAVSPQDGARKSVSSSPEDSIASCVTSEDSKDLAKRAEEASSDKEESTKGKKKDAEKEKKVVAKAEGKEDADYDEEDDEGMLSNEKSMFFPGSPSFRVFFIGNLDNDDDDDDDDEEDNDHCKKDGTKDKRHLPDHDTSPKKEQEPLPKKAKKGRKKRSLKMVKGGQTAVKNLFNVRPCYTPSCGSSHDREHLLKGKTLD